LAKQAQLEKFEKLSKKELYARLKQQYDFERLKRAQKFSYKRKLEESHEGGASSSAPGSGCGSHDAAPCCTVQEPAMKKRRSGSINIVDPIMFTKVGKQKFVYVRPNGKAVQYNIAPLVDYILCTGDFCEPETRIPFTDADLKKIDEAAIKYNLKKQSVLEARKNVAFYSELKFRRDAIFGLERCLAELAAGMLAAVEEADWELAELAQMRLVMQLLPGFADAWAQLRAADAPAARAALRHHREYLAGPPNRPARDPQGLQAVVQGFLDQLEQGIQPDFGF